MLGENQYALAMVTDFMQRIHTNLRESAEVVFMDSTTHVDGTNSTITLVVCSSPAGALPLAVLMASDQSESSYRKCMKV